MEPGRGCSVDSTPDAVRVARGGLKEGASWNSLPHDMRLLVLEHIPLLQFAQMACVCKEFHAAFRARVALRQAIIDGLPRVFRGTSETRLVLLGDLLGGHPPSSTALPRDLVGVPEMAENLQVYRHLNSPQIVADIGEGLMEGHYVGFCLRGVPEGPGEWTGGGDRYLGTWRAGRPHGHGEARWPIYGMTYIGDWHDGTRTGHGSALWDNGCKYVGAWRDDMMHGQGEYTAEDGARYVGESEENRFCGHGIRTCPDGTKHVGSYRGGEPDGPGVKVWPDGSTYAGEFADGRLHGLGAVTWPDGSKYVGRWEDNQRKGWGAHLWPNGAEFAGLWEDDEPVM